MKIKEKKAISLIVLVITIIVLSILAATVIISISNTNVIEEANKTVFKSDMSNYKEVFEMYVTAETMKNNSFDSSLLDGTYDQNESTFKTIFGEVSEKYQDGLKIQDGKLVYETDDETEKAIADSLGMKALEYIGVEKTDDGKSAYIGCYVDADRDGIIDSVIFADLAVGGSGTWNPAGSTDTATTTGGAWRYSKSSDLKEYAKTGEIYEGKFGINPVLKLVEGTTGSDRFYCMALEDITNPESPSGLVTWYGAAYGKISDYADITKLEFGKGITNTNTMVEKWVSKSYGEQNNDGYKDVWGVIKGEVEKGWFLPSASEWAAFGSAFGITASNFSSMYGLRSYYWSSSLSSAGDAYEISFISGRFFDCYIYDASNKSLAWTRLSTTY